MKCKFCKNENNEIAESIYRRCSDCDEDISPMTMCVQCSIKYKKKCPKCLEYDLK